MLFTFQPITCVFRTTPLVSKKCHLLVAIALLPFAPFANDLLQLKYGVTWSSSQFMETIGNIDRYLPDLQGCRHSLACVVQYTLHFLCHAHIQLSDPHLEGLGKYLGEFCLFELELKQSVLNLRRFSLRDTKRSHKRGLESWLAVGLLMTLRSHILSWYLIS